MKRLLSSATLFLCSLMTFAQFNGSGSGTEDDPYLIFNPIQLSQIRIFLGQDNVCFKLMADVDLSGYIEDEYPAQGWMPIGNTTSFFQGVLDGNNHFISGLWINRGISDYVGLFGYTRDAQIKNLSIINVNITGQNYVGNILSQ